MIGYIQYLKAFRSLMGKRLYSLLLRFKKGTFLFLNVRMRPEDRFLLVHLGKAESDQFSSHFIYAY